MPQSGCFIIQLPRRVLRVYWLGYLPGSVFRERVSGASSLVCTGLKGQHKASQKRTNRSQTTALLLSENGEQFTMSSADAMTEKANKTQPKTGQRIMLVVVVLLAGEVVALIAKVVLMENEIRSLRKTVEDFKPLQGITGISTMFLTFSLMTERPLKQNIKQINRNIN